MKTHVILIFVLLIFTVPEINSLEEGKLAEIFCRVLLSLISLFPEIG